MDNVLNFVYDNWDEVNDVPLPNRLSDYIHQDDNEFFFNQGKYLIKFSHTAKYFNFFIFFSKLRYFVLVMKKFNF